MEFLYVCGTIAMPWQHRDPLMVDAFDKKKLPSIFVPLLQPFTLVWCCILLWLLVDLEMYLFERTFPAALKNLVMRYEVWPERTVSRQTVYWQSL